jgi:hypothetical protein
MSNLKNLKPPKKICVFASSRFALVDRFYQFIRGEQIAASYRLCGSERNISPGYLSFDSPLPKVRAGYSRIFELVLRYQHIYSSWMTCHPPLYLEIRKLNQNTEMANREKLLRLKWGNTSCQTGTDRARTYFQAHKFRTEFVSKISLSNSSHVLQATTLRNQETSSKTVAVKSFHLFSVR